MDYKITISGFGDASANGDYAYVREQNGYSMWRKDSSYFIIYQTTWMPWTNTGNYFIVKVS
jgi:hypothetical protein